MTISFLKGAQVKSYVLGKNHAVEGDMVTTGSRTKCVLPVAETCKLTYVLLGDRQTSVAYKCPLLGSPFDLATFRADAPISNNPETSIFPPTSPLRALLSRSRMTLLLPVSEELWKMSYPLQILISMLAPKVCLLDPPYLKHLRTPLDCVLIQ